jgi:NTP pyrophosphatase (non-canonical NTP hydrolase)
MQNLPIVIFDNIERHVEKAEKKHPHFADSIIPERLSDPQVISNFLKEARIKRDNTRSVYDVLQEEVLEVFEAVYEGRIGDARDEIYDTIAVLVRLDRELMHSEAGFPYEDRFIPILPKSTKEI